MKKKIFSVLFALVLVVSMSLVTAVPVAANTTWHVDDDGVEYPNPDFNTISAAMANASDGDTIIVHQGTYDETSRTQRGVYVGVTDVIVKGASCEDRPVVIGGFYIDSSGAGATVEGFDVQQPWEAAIQVDDADGVTIRNNHVDGTGNLHPIIPWPGISVLYSDNVIVEGNHIKYTTGAGIWLTCTNSFIQDNRIHYAEYAGILLAPHSGEFNSGNLIAGNHVTRAGTDGIRLGVGADGNTVENNRVNASRRDGIRAVGPANNNTIQNNTSLGNRQYDINDLDFPTSNNIWSGNRFNTAGGSATG